MDIVLIPLPTRIPRGATKSVKISCSSLRKNSKKSIDVNYPFAKDKWASRFTATCLLFRRVRSLTVAPHVYSQVPYEVLMSCTDNANIQLLI